MVRSEVSSQNEAEPGRPDLERQYERLLEEFGAGIRRVVSSYESVPQEREDLLQDVRLAIWIALPRFRSESSLRTFVFRIVHNRALTYVWHRRRAGVPEDLDSVEIADTRVGPEGSVIQSSNRSRLLAAIQRLPIPMKQVITLALEEISNAEIAEILGITENHVAVRLTRARSLLRKQLGGK